MVKVLWLSLWDEIDMDEMGVDLMEALKERAEVIKCTTREVTFEALQDNIRSSLFIFEPSLINKKVNKKLARAIKEWTKAGGTTVFGGCCGSFVKPLSLKQFFSEVYGLPWESGSYHRADFAANNAARLRSSVANIATINAKALHLRNITTGDALYLEDGVAPEDVSESPIVLRAFGDGKLGWIGDVNNETELIPLTLAMLGV
ncbi:MAG: hypothetical protein LQ340_006670 [Diploschistes diacapsis]|nr:MAG: hypothetical protein LQ340_006670 [Diploschistes diacapsis]